MLAVAQRRAVQFYQPYASPIRALVGLAGSGWRDSQASQLALSNQYIAPDGGPFDWSIPRLASVEIWRDRRLELHFLGTENVKLEGIGNPHLLGPGNIAFR